MQEIKITKVQQIVDAIEPNTLVDYYAFPEVIYTFGYSKKNSYPMILDLGNAKWFIRMERTQAILIYWSGDINMDIYQKGCNRLNELGINRFGGLLSFKDFGAVKADVTLNRANIWMSQHTWTGADMSPRNRQRIRKTIRETDWVMIQDEKGVKDAIDVLNKWYNYSVDNKRHFMVIYGHYEVMIKNILNLINSRFFLAYNKKTHKPYGLVGGYIDPENEIAAITETKHDFTNHYAGIALWAYWLDYIHDELGYSICNCGDTADELKAGLGFIKRPAFGVKRTSIQLNKVVQTKTAIEMFGGM